MPTADCRFLHHGRIMRCLTCLLLLPETLKKSRKVGRLPLCYELLALSLTSRKKQKMAAELYPAANTNNTNLSSGTTVADAEKTKEVQVKQAAGGGSSTVTTPTTQQNINNNNVEPPSWQCSHPTLRERYHRPRGDCPKLPVDLLLLFTRSEGVNLKLICGQQHQNGAV